MSHKKVAFGNNELLPPIVKYGLTYLFVQSEFGLCCPLSMTDSSTRTLIKFGKESLVKTFFDNLTSFDKDNFSRCYVHNGASSWSRCWCNTNFC